MLKTTGKNAEVEILPDALVARDDARSRPLGTVVAAMPRLSDSDIARDLKTLPGWSLADGMLRKTFAHASFPEAIVFVNAAAQLAEDANHHPDIDIRYSNITLSLVTHDAGESPTRTLRWRGKYQARGN